MRILSDSHSHSKFSHDGREKADKLIQKAQELGLSYYAITEHLDRDYKYCKSERFIPQLRLKAYYRALQKLREKYSDSATYVAFGVEAGFAPEAVEWYQKTLPLYDFDVVINSIHTMDGGDAYFGKIFEGKTQDEVYNRYLDLLIESVNVPYDYDIIAHIGYVTRYVNFENYTLCQDKYMDKIDTLLKEIIARDKTIEINTHIRHAEMKYLPEKGILQRYYELGGRNVTFSSDAHLSESIGERYDMVSTLAKGIGFTHWTVYKKRVAHKIEIE
ncbi:MAG: histidinol-phosphatase HisJ family protein [Clostridia bacterium]|nr:histidinol-phosphatase HisJ family protein [Clostridia bacterium]